MIWDSRWRKSISELPPAEALRWDCRTGPFPFSEVILDQIQEFHERISWNPTHCLQKSYMPLPNKLNNFITFFCVCVSTMNGFNFKSLGRPSCVFSSSLWGTVFVLFKPACIGLVLRPHHHFSLPQLSFSVQHCPLFGFHRGLRGSLVKWETHLAANSPFFSRIFFSARSDLPVQFIYHILAQNLDWPKGKGGRSEERW